MHSCSQSAVLGAIRTIILIVPRVGARTAEILESPIMLVGALHVMRGRAQCVTLLLFLYLVIFRKPV